MHFKDGRFRKLTKVCNIALLSNGRLCIQRNDKRLKHHFIEEVIPISEVDRFYSYGQ